MPPSENQESYREQIGAVGFDCSLKGLSLLETGDDFARVSLPVSSELLNAVGTLHGGAIATLIDDAGTVAIVCADPADRPGVTTDLTISYTRPAPLGETVVAEARVLKLGRTLAFVTVDVSNSAGKLLAQGRMTKFMGHAR